MDAPKETGNTEQAQSVVGRFTGMLMKSPVNPAIGASRAQMSKYKTVVKVLGIKRIHGVEAHGMRYTRTIPEGAIGNDAPLVSKEEYWIATRLAPSNPTLRHVSKDPQNGKSTTKLVNISLIEPDPTIFQPPEGYKIVTLESHSASCPKELKQPAQ
jgi:hypothetical protein